MDRHPGGEEHTLRMLELAALPAGSRWLDMGAGDGSALQLLEAKGYRCVGIDLAPRGELVQRGDYLHMDYPEGIFDGILSQCSFFVSGDIPGAFREAARVLRRGGRLIYSDVCQNLDALLEAAGDAGFSLLYREDQTPQWREYYLEALWRDECDYIPRGKGFTYQLLLLERT